MRVAVVGSAGFVGRAVCSAASARGMDVVAIRAPRLACPFDRDPREAAEAWSGSHPAEFDDLGRALARVEVVINAAGLALPGSSPTPELFGANAVLPVVIARAAGAAGVRRLVHVSSAAVQGRRDPLDETRACQPLTPYGRSKAAGEQAILGGDGDRPHEVVVYRPTSVQGADRAMTRQLVRVAKVPLVPVAAGYDPPLPVALIDNVAAGIALAAAAQACPDIILQPWETMTTRSLLAALGARRLVPVPRRLLRVAIGSLDLGGRAAPALTALARRAELLAFGQAQSAQALAGLGFTPPAGPDRYSELATTPEGLTPRRVG